MPPSAMRSRKKKQTKIIKNRSNKRPKIAKTPFRIPEKKKVEKPSNATEKALVASDVASDGAAKIQNLLEPYSKDQLVEFLCDAAVKDSALLNRIQEIADRDVSHRKIFVYGLGWDTTHQALLSAFQPCGEIEDSKVVVDRATGKAKGYGFVLFKSRKGAMNALKQPQKKISNRVTSCQLASIGPFSPHQSPDTMARKIYVSNVHADADAQKLRAFFAKFGELETGPLGFDMSTGKSRGFALFVYKTLEGAKKALEEPYKMFEGHQLHCQRATENKNKHVAQQAQQQQIVQAPMLAAVAAAQNLALFSQHPSLNPAYNALAMNPNAGLVPGSVNPLVAGALNASAFQSPQIPGSFGAQIPGSSIGSLNPALQGLQSYQSSHLGQSSSSRTLGTDGSLPGYSSYL